MSFVFHMGTFWGKEQDSTFFTSEKTDMENMKTISVN